MKGAQKICMLAKCLFFTVLLRQAASVETSNVIGVTLLWALCHWCNAQC